MYVEQKMNRVYRPVEGGTGGCSWLVGRKTSNEHVGRQTGRYAGMYSTM